MGVERAQLAQILDLFVEDDWRNVYAGELEVRPPAAPTNGSATAAFRASPLTSYTTCVILAVDRSRTGD